MARLRRISVVLLSACIVASCGKPKRSPAEGGDPAPVRPSGVEKGKVMPLTVTSAAFGAGKPIPKPHAYKGEGENVSPPLAWTGAPAATVSFALIADDPDAPSPKRPRPKPWVHWVLYNIPAATTSLKAGDAGGGTAGTTDFGEEGYGGPMPPPGSGTHRYFFKIYALDAALKLAPGATKDALEKAMEGHVLARGELFGTYERR